MNHFLGLWEVRLFIDLFCAAMFWWGGKCFLTARRDIMPPILATYSALLCWAWWAYAMLPVIAVFHLGYGVKSFFRHCFGDGWGRGVWGILGGICLGTWAICTGHFGAPTFFQHGPGWLWFIIYLGSCFTLENILKKLPQAVGDPLICFFSFGSIVWFLH